MKLLENFEYRKAAVMSILAMCVCGLAAGLQASTITSVTFSVGPANPTIQINGVVSIPSLPWINWLSLGSLAMITDLSCICMTSPITPQRLMRDSMVPQDSTPLG